MTQCQPPFVELFLIAGCLFENGWYGDAEVPLPCSFLNCHLDWFAVLPVVFSCGRALTQSFFLLRVFRRPPPPPPFSGFSAY